MTLITLITLITDVVTSHGKIVVVDLADLTGRYHLTQQAARGVIILVERLCHLSCTHALWKLFGEQVQDFLAFLRASDLLGIAHLRPHGCDWVEPECELLLLLDIAAGHKQGGLMLASLAFEDQMRHRPTPVRPIEPVISSSTSSPRIFRKWWIARMETR